MTRTWLSDMAVFILLARGMSDHSWSYINYEKSQETTGNKKNIFNGNAAWMKQRKNSVILQLWDPGIPESLQTADIPMTQVGETLHLLKLLW